MLYLWANTSRQAGEYPRYGYEDTMASDKNAKNDSFTMGNRPTALIATIGGMKAGLTLRINLFL